MFHRVTSGFHQNTAHAASDNLETIPLRAGTRSPFASAPPDDLSS
jgi:hypothetical protein